MSGVVRVTGRRRSIAPVSFYYALAMTEPVPAPGPAPAMAAVVPTPTRNRLGIAALILVLITLALPIIGSLVYIIAAAIEGSEGDAFGYAILGAFFFIPVASSLIAPIAILGVVLGIVSLFRRGQRKVQGIFAIILGIYPSLLILLLPAAIDTFF